MDQNKPYRQLPDGRVLLDYGPMTLSVCAKKNGGSNKTDEKETSFESGTPIGKPDLMGSKEAD